jgi:hypothetical protein
MTDLLNLTRYSLPDLPSLTPNGVAATSRRRCQNSALHGLVIGAAGRAGCGDRIPRTRLMISLIAPITMLGQSSWMKWVEQATGRSNPSEESAASSLCVGPIPVGEGERNDAAQGVPGKAMVHGRPRLHPLQSSRFSEGSSIRPLPLSAAQSFTLALRAAPSRDAIY